MRIALLQRMILQKKTSFKCNVLFFLCVACQLNADVPQQQEIFLPLPAHLMESNWELNSANDNVSVYTQVVEGSKFIAVKLVTEFDAGAQLVLDALGHGEVCVPWIKACKSSRVLQSKTGQDYIAYTHLNFPWPFSDRYIIYRSITNVNAEKNSVTVVRNTVPEYPFESQLTQMISKNRMDIVELAPNKVKFTWVLHVDPRGRAPVSAVNKNMVVMPKKDLLSLRDLLQKTQ